MNGTLLRVVKVGGSLLDWPPLASALRQWLDSQPEGITVLVCGGGPLTDVIRRLDRDFWLGEEAAHWLCIDALAITARVLKSILPEAQFVDDYERLVARLADQRVGAIVIDPRPFLATNEALLPGRPLPHSWNATTDSIAARLAKTIGADELVLLKSAAGPANASLAELAAAGLVDSHFPLAAANLDNVRLVNLRGLEQDQLSP